MGDDISDSGPSPGLSQADDGDDGQWQSQSMEETPKSADTATASGDAATKPNIPLQKRRRVTRACDECRRKKIKCDGKQPCTHCTVYSYECTYDQPSNRRRNPAPQYIEALEARLHKAEALLRVVLPNIDLDDPKVEARGIDQILAMAQQRKSQGPPPPSAPKPQIPDDNEEAQLESMVQSTGSLELDDNGDWDYHGHSSGFAFLRRIRAHMGDTFGDPRQLPIGRRGLKPTRLDSPRSNSESPLDSLLPNHLDLPPKEVTKSLCRNALDDCCALMRFIHQPTFYQKVEDIYSVDPERYSTVQLKFLPLLYAVIAVGCMFSTVDDNRLDTDGYEKYIGQGYQYYNASRQMIEITDCRDLIGLQTITVMILFLQATAKLSTCYAYVGIAMRACLRLGLHRNVNGSFDLIQLQERRRIFWTIRKLDSYVAAMLGLPQMLSDDDVDQELPAEVDDESITPTVILPQPPEVFPLLKATNAHTRLVDILRKVVKYVYPIKGMPMNVQSSGHNGYMISHAKIREIEGDLQVWMDELPMELRPSDDAPQDLARVQQLLRMSYAHVQMMMYRPFLHYVSQISQSGGMDKRTFACAAACVSVARNIVHITSEMKRRGLLIGAYWFVMYTTYFAIVSLVFFCLENPLTNTGREILKDAMEGRETLASLARRSLAADRCSTSLSVLFENLPQKIEERRIAAGGGSTATKKRPPPKTGAEPTPLQSVRNIPTEEPVMGVQRARTFPNDVTSPPSKRISNPDPKRIISNPDDNTRFRASPQPWNVGVASGVATPESLRSMTESIQQSPQSSTLEPQFGNSNLFNFKNVMFPSDNPFAYPNQPMSTLEDGFPPDEQSNYSNYFIPEHNSQSNIPFEQVPGNVYASIPPYLARPPTSQSIGSGNGANMQPFQGIPNAMNIQGMQQGNNISQPQGNDEFWAPQMNGNGGGLGTGVNLDDIFGGEQWNNMWDNSVPPAAYKMQ